MGKKGIAHNSVLLILIVSCIWILFVSYAFAQISGADSYININWKCVLPNQDLGFEANNSYLGEAYWWSGSDSIPSFNDKISSGKYIPGGYQETKGAADRAGIDCSGFVGKIWGFNNHEYGTSTLPNISRRIKKENLQTGDILNNSGNHVVLFDGLSDNLNYLYIYHAKGSGDPNGIKYGNEIVYGNMVVHERVS